jgi:hypothetical protein
MLILVAGPAPIVAASLGLARWSQSQSAEPPSANHAAPHTQPSTRAVATPTSEAHESLRSACIARANEIEQRLDNACAVIERTPFVLAGDMSTKDLDDWHRQTVGPAARAMANAYFRTPPDKPITILLFSGEESYNHYAQHLYGDEGISIYGYYKPSERTLVMNIGTGGGTLVHELTHALMAFDFPKVPDWFNEGLASLHEQCQFRADESAIEGLPNWRLNGLQEAIRNERLPSLEAMINNPDFRGRQVGLNYAQARYFCLYMQRENVLVDFYRHFRERHDQDPRGLGVVRTVFPDKSWSELDSDFQRWVLTLQR